MLIIACFGLAVFAFDSAVCRTVSDLLSLVCFVHLRFDLIWSNYECVIFPEVNLFS